MNYAIEILIKERDLITRCLNEWESKEYPEAKKERDKRLKELNEAIKKLEDENASK